MHETWNFVLAVGDQKVLSDYEAAHCDYDNEFWWVRLLFALNYCRKTLEMPHSESQDIWYHGADKEIWDMEYFQTKLSQYSTVGVFINMSLGEEKEVGWSN